MNKKMLFPLVISLILIYAYGTTIAPGISWANGGVDGGDLVTAAAVNGVPHPTGYPLYLLIAKLFQWLPIGNLAYRTNLLSAFCTCLATLMVYFTVNRLLTEQQYAKIVSSVAALAFGLSPLVWSQAIITEVYGLQSLLVVCILYQTLFFETRPANNFFRGLLFGIALGNHITIILMLPLLLWERGVVRIRPVSHIILRVFGLLLGSTIYVILPLRALNHPVINWCNPITFRSFVQLVSGQIYQSYFSVNYIIDHARAWIGLLIEQFSIPGMVIGIFNLIEGKKMIRHTFPIMWIFIAYGVFAMVYTSYDSYVYLIQTVLIFSLWLGQGIQRLLKIVAGYWHKADLVLSLLFFFILILRIITVLPNVDASKDYRAELFGKRVLDTAPGSAMIFTRDDPTTFSLWYFHFALEKRPDIKVVVEGLLRYDWYRQSLRSTYADLIIPDLLELSTNQLINSNQDLPVCYVEYPGETIIYCDSSKNN